MGVCVGVGVCEICTVVQGLFKESHGSRISFQLPCLFFPHLNTDSQVVGNEHMLTCQRTFHPFIYHCGGS